MCSSTDKSHVEAWKSLIDFTKTTISLATAILTALIGYFVVKGTGWDNDVYNYIPIAFLVLSVVLSLFGFGRAITAVKTGESKPLAVILSNSGFVALLIAVLSIIPLRLGESFSVDDVLVSVEHSTTKFPRTLSAANCKEIYNNGDKYKLLYEVDGVKVEVVFLISENRVVSIK